MADSMVPRLGLAAVLGLAALLIGGIVLRSPDTHHNLGLARLSGYQRTAVAGLSGTIEGREAGPAFARLATIRLGRGLAMEPGRRAYLQAGCGTCHGLNGEGGPVGPALAGAVPEVVERMVRDGPAGMPAYSESSLSAARLRDLSGYLAGLTVEEPSASELAGLQRLSFDPNTPVSALLQGKAALRRSCGACHPAPGKDEILSAFGSDDEVTSLVMSMVQETNLQLDEAELIARYMLAIRNGADPLAGAQR